ncbi:MAG: endonuclease [Bacteroidota bacterium]
MKIIPCLVFMLFYSAISTNLSSSSFDVKTSENRASLDSIKIKSQNVSVIFWNAENLYDPYDDSTTLDDEFTSAGGKRWNWTKFSKKLNHVAKTLLAAGEWSAPSVVGFCEVENRYVLNKLIYQTPLKPWKYKMIHHESPDQRGVDVALLYRPDMFKVISERTFRIMFPFDSLSQTREILMVKGIFYNRDTIHLFVNHWPSRRGGYLQSQPRRNHVARVLRKVVDSIQLVNPNANILIMGDFNDEPENESLKTVLGAKTVGDSVNATTLLNLMGIRNQSHPEGTIKYRDQWSTFDQFIISGALISGNSGLQTGTGNVKIVKADFLLDEDKTYFGEKLKRTYSGPRYQGGFSDHLPIKLLINQSNK